MMHPLLLLWAIAFIMFETTLTLTPSYGRTPEEGLVGMPRHVCWKYLSRNEDIIGSEDEHVARAKQLFHAKQFREAAIEACKAIALNPQSIPADGALDHALDAERSQKMAQERAIHPLTSREKRISAYDAFLAKHHFVEPSVSRTILEMAIDPDRLSGRLVFVSGYTINISENRKVVFIRIALPYSPQPRYAEVAFHPQSPASDRSMQWTCAGRILGSMTVRSQLDGVLKSIPDIKEIECLRYPTD